MRLRRCRYAGPAGLLEKEILWHLSDSTLPTYPGLHGYDLSRKIAAGDARRALGFRGELPGRPRGDLRASGHIYRALGHLELCGVVESEWEDPDVALAARRPRRRYYHLTENGWARARMLEQAVRLQRRLVAADAWPWAPREFTTRTGDDRTAPSPPGAHGFRVESDSTRAAR